MLSTSSVARRGQLGHQLDDLAGQLLEVDVEGLISTSSGSCRSSMASTRGLQIRLLLDEIEHAKARQPLDHERVVVLPHLEWSFHDLGHGSDGVEVGRAGVFLFGPALGDDADDPSSRTASLIRAMVLARPTAKWKHTAGKRRRVAQRQDRQNLRNFFEISAPEAAWPP